MQNKKTNRIGSGILMSQLELMSTFSVLCFSLVHILLWFKHQLDVADFEGNLRLHITVNPFGVGFQFTNNLFMNAVGQVDVIEVEREGGGKRRLGRITSNLHPEKFFPSLEEWKFLRLVIKNVFFVEKPTHMRCKIFYFQ